MEFSINSGHNVNGNVSDISSRHPRGAYVLLCDGSVRFLDDTVDAKILEAMTTVDGREAFILPDY